MQEPAQEQSALQSREEQILKNENDLSNTRRYTLAKLFLYLFYGHCINTALVDYCLAHTSRLAHGRRSLIDAVNILGGFVVICLCIYLVKALATNKKKTKLASIHFSGIFIYKLVFLFRFFMPDHKGRATTAAFDCDRRFPMLEIHATKIAFSSAFEVVAMTCFLIVNTKLSKHRTQKRYMLNQLDPSVSASSLRTREEHGQGTDGDSSKDAKEKHAFGHRKYEGNEGPPPYDAVRGGTNKYHFLEAPKQIDTHGCLSDKFYLRTEDSNCAVLVNLEAGSSKEIGGYANQDFKEQDTSQLGQEKWRGQTIDTLQGFEISGQIIQNDLNSHRQVKKPRDPYSQMNTEFPGSRTPLNLRESESNELSDDYEEVGGEQSPREMPRPEGYQAITKEMQKRIIDSKNRQFQETDGNQRPSQFKLVEMK